MPPARILVIEESEANIQYFGLPPQYDGMAALRFTQYQRLNTFRS
jgi:hypothetical protein